MDCPPASTKWAPDGPRTWELSARAIEGFCSRLLNAQQAATLFVSPRCAQEHGPLLEELVERGVEIGLQIHPPNLLDGRFKQPLGQYGAEDQHSLIELAAEQVQEAIGVWPKSVRAGNYSASDATYGVLYALGFRQGSLSLPGRSVPRQAAEWSQALPDPHYVDRENRLQDGSLPFLELPVTADATRQYRTGYPYDLCIETSTFEDWHHPIIEAQLQRMADANTVFRTLCIVTQNALPYHLDADRHAKTLEALISYIESLEEQYEIVPCTLSSAHERFRGFPSR